MKPAWYSLEGTSKLANIVNLLHLPYTLWHLSYVSIGILLSPAVHLDRSIAVLIAFFLGLGIGAHSLDETMGNPLETKLSKQQLYAIGFAALSGAILIGLYYVAIVSILILPFVVLETFFAIAYNLEILGGVFHSSIVFCVSWGSIPFLTGYFVNSLSIGPTILLVSLAFGMLTLVQRNLSLQSRLMRRKLGRVISLQLETGEFVPISNVDISAPSERSLKILNLMMPLLTLALLLWRIT